MTPENLRLANLRGSLDPVEVGARGLESVARNTDCMRLRMITVVGLTANEVIKSVYGLVPDAMSPFAMSLTQNFQRRLLDNAGASLLTAYREKHLLEPHEAKIGAVATVAIGNSAMASQRRAMETHRLIGLKSTGDANAPNLILNPRLELSLAGVTHAVELDYLVAGDRDAFYRVGTVKSYADRGGKTDQADIRAAIREATVGTLALQQWLSARGFDPASAVDRVDLILRAPGSFSPRLYASMRAEAELASLERTLSAAQSDLDEIERNLAPGATFAQPGVIDQIPNNYRSNCKEHCALWQRCRAQALANGLPVILGDQAAEQLAAAGTVVRAVDLMNGRGRAPDNSAEASLAAGLREAAVLLDRIANG